MTQRTTPTCSRPSRAAALAWALVLAWTVALGGCGGAPPLRPAAVEDAALLRDADEGHFLLPAEPVATASLRWRIGARRQPAGPAQPRLTGPTETERLRRRRGERARSRRRAAGRRAARRERSQASRRRPRRALRERVGGDERARRELARGGKKPDLSAQQRVRAAVQLLGSAGLRGRAFVDHVLHASGGAVRVDAAVPYAGGLWRLLRDRRVRRPRPGDLVFFKNTLDLNGNARPDDGVTWVAVVERVEARRVLFVGQRAGKVRRMSLSTARPSVVRDAADQVVNTRLVRWPHESSPRTAGQCFAGYARP